MKKLLLLFAGSAMFVTTACAQKSAEVGLYLGCSFYLGDLNPNGFFNQFTRFAGGGIFRYNLNNRVAARLNLLFGTVTADDAQSPSASQRQRNLNFKSPIDELSAQMEFNFLEYELGNPKHAFTPYIFAGVGAFKMNPKGEVNGSWVSLQPLGTEGQGTSANSHAPYHLIQPCIPFGLGLKTSFAKGLCLSIEWGMRKTFTGYIDDVNKTYVNPAVLLQYRGANGPMAVAMADRSLSPDKAADAGTQRGNGKNDWYSFAGIILSIKINTHHEKCWSYF